jgi:two-component system response regulator YesN
MSEPYTILICDDEPATRTGLRDSFDWQALGIRVAGIAANGEEALDIVSRESPDIILSDVRMPIMDGLEMAGLLGKMGFAGKLVFMSAYGEVEYLKAAMRVEAIDYILKPIEAVP